MTDGFIPSHGGYEDLLSYQRAVIVYDGTVRFCERFLNTYDRTVDQMACLPKPRRRQVQAERSGKQNIIEGSQASGTSKETEIKLTNVARASLEELLEDYRDWLRTHDAPLWDKNSKEALYVRKLASGRIPPPGQQNGTDATNGTNENGRPKQLFIRELDKKARRLLRQSRLPRELAQYEQQTAGPCPFRAPELNALFKRFKTLKDRRSQGHGRRHSQPFVLACSSVAVVMGAGPTRCQFR